jgi:hypothetical protein
MVSQPVSAPRRAARRVFGIAVRAEVKLLGPALFRVERAEEFHHEGGKPFGVLRDWPRGP